MIDAGFFTGPRLADTVLFALAAEFVVLVAVGRGWRVVTIALLPGAFLVLALRGALGGMGWPWIVLPLALSWPAHIADLRSRRAR